MISLSHEACPKSHLREFAEASRQRVWSAQACLRFSLAQLAARPCAFMRRDAVTRYQVATTYFDYKKTPYV